MMNNKYYNFELKYILPISDDDTECVAHIQTWACNPTDAVIKIIEANILPCKNSNYILITSIKLT